MITITPPRRTSDDRIMRALVAIEEGQRTGLGLKAIARKALEDAGVLALEQQVEDLQGQLAELRLRQQNARAAMDDAGPRAA